MAAFSTDALWQRPADFALVRDGGVAKVLSAAVLAAIQDELAELRYSLLTVDTAAWDEDGMLRGLGDVLDFPDYYGMNWPALADCLGDVASGDYGWDPKSAGLAVTLAGFGHFYRRDERLAHQLLNYLTATSREALLFGHRILWLLHVDDADFHTEPVGAIAVPWNGREWMDAKRR